MSTCKAEALREAATGHDIGNPRQPRRPGAKYAYSGELDADALNPLADVTDAVRQPASALASAGQPLSTQVHGAEADAADAEMLR